MASSVCLSASSSSWKCRCIPPPIEHGGHDMAPKPPYARRVPAEPGHASLTPSLAEAAGDVVLGALVARVGEQLPGDAELHQLSQEHEPRVVGHPGRLLHVVGDDHDRIAVLQLQ